MVKTKLVSVSWPVSTLAFVMAVLAGGLTACTRGEKTSSTPSSPAQGTEAGTAAPQVATTGAAIKVGLVLDKGGKDDKSFNSAAFRGVSQAKQEFGVEVKDVESPDDAAFEPALRTFAEREFPLVIAVGFAQADAVKKVAPQFPKTHFALVDAVVEAPNVASLMFSEHEGSYLVGYLAALMSKTNKVGFIGGMDIALIRRFQMGYEAGAKAANAKTEILTNYAGVTSSAWANPARGKELALLQYGRGVDVIFHAAGATGMGLFDAAEEKKMLAIGVDSNQNSIKPGRIATSMLKRVDVAVYNIVKDEVEGKFSAGVRTFGLKDKGVDYAVDEHNKALIEPYQTKLEDLRGKIVSGEIKVPDYYELNKKHEPSKKQ